MSGFLPVGQSALTSASFVIMKTRKCNLTYKRFKEGPVALFVNSPSRVTRNTDDKGHKVSFFLYSFILTLQISRTKMLNLRQKKTKMFGIVSTNTWQKHQHTLFHLYQIQSHFSNPPRTTSVILDLRRGGVDTGDHWRQFHRIVHHIPEWCNENFDPSVEEWCWMRPLKRR